MDQETKTTATSNASRPQNTSGSTTQMSPNGQHRQGGGSSSSPNSPSKAKQNHEQNEHEIHHHKKSVFTKVKETARKLKKSLSVRKRRDENERRSPCITPLASTGSLDDDKDRSEYFGSPLYEPQVAPNTNTQSDNNGSSKKPDINIDSSQSGLTISTGEETEIAKPDAKKPDINIDSKQSGLTISTHEETEIAKPDAEKAESSVEEKDTNISSMQDKGISVKEYIMNKFEPGEEERALSQAITHTISPKCEKVKEAMNSLLGNEEAADSISKTTNVELDVTPSGSPTEPNDKKLTSLTDDPNPSNTLEPNLVSSSATSSNLKPNSG